VGQVARLLSCLIECYVDRGSGRSGLSDLLSESPRLRFVVGCVTYQR